MQNSDMLRHPVIEVSIAGSVIENRPSAFRLSTLSGCPAVTAELRYPADCVELGKKGDTISVSLVGDDKKDLYFTGVIYEAARQAQYRVLYLTDGCRKLWRTHFTAAYRKEKAAAILDDVLLAAGVTEKKITVPDVELARFSTAKIPASFCLDLLIDALWPHGVEGLSWFFDQKDIFRFGTVSDSGKNEGAAENFESGKNILRSGADWIEVLPRPVRHTQKIIVNSRELLTVRTDLLISRSSSRLTLWVKEAA